MNKNLILVRGVSGSGKTTFANLISNIVLSADDYFTDRQGNYNFDATYLPSAHESCRSRTEDHMKAGFSKICVANTFTQEWEMKEYFELAKKYGYRVFTVIVENRHGGTNVHNVPDAVLQKQKDRFNIKL
jgi:predicted kinase